MHDHNTGKQEAQASSLAPSLPTSPTSKARRHRGSHPILCPKRAGSCFYTAPSGLQQSPLMSEQNACQKKKKNNIRCSCQQTERARGFAKMDSIRDRTAHNPIRAEATMDSTPFMESTRFQGDCAQAELSWDTLPL